jgi:hypothetical protein
VAVSQDGLLLAAGGRSFAEADVELIRSNSEDVPRERRCVPCQAVYRRLIRQPPTIGHRLVEVRARD